MFINTLHLCCTNAPTKPLSAKKRFSQTGGRREEFFPDDVVQYQVQDDHCGFGDGDTGGDGHADGRNAGRGKLANLMRKLSLSLFRHFF